jgi:colicin import membrane protein
MKNIFKYVFGYVFFTIILIASQACITLARAENSDANVRVFTEEAANAELAKIKQEKLAIEARSKEQEAACYKKFAVSSCLKDVKTEQLAALNNIKRRELDIKDQMRAKKAESDQNKKTKSTQGQAATQAAKQASNDNGDGKGGEQKTVSSEKVGKNPRSLKAEKSPKSEAEILAEKDANAKSRESAAQQRLADSNKKVAASQKKAQIRANKNSQAGVNAAKYKQKLLLAEEHKNEAEKTRLEKSSKSKPKSAPLPLPPAAELTR